MEHRTGSDQGFTLIELVVAASITGVLATVIGAAFTVGVQTSGAANARIAASRGGPVLSSYFPADVQSSATIAVSTTPCTSAVPGVATMTWVDVDSAGASTSKSVAYTCQVGATTTDLVRTYTAGATSVSSIVVYGVASAAVACAPDCTTPRSATLTVTAGDFTFSLTGRRRLT